MKKLFNILLFASFLFVIWFLYKYDYLQVRELKINGYLLFISVILLFAGFVLSTLSWWNALHIHGIGIRKRDALVSHGLAIFTKYIPGKIWSIVGRAAYISARYPSPMDALSFISLKEQLIYIWLGILVSLFPMIILQGITVYSGLTALVFLGLTFLLFLRWAHDLLILIFKKVFRKNFVIVMLTAAEAWKLVRYVIIYWIVWMGAFYFFIIAVIGQASPVAVFAFPISISVGIMSVIFPGGIGVRETIMTGFLVISGIPLEQASVISVTNRTWFILGEVFMFLLSAGLSGRDRIKKAT